MAMKSSRLGPTGRYLNIAVKTGTGTKIGIFSFRSISLPSLEYVSNEEEGLNHDLSRLPPKWTGPIACGQDTGTFLSG